ncbi:MAG: hypothetical protein KDA47_02365 [Planctomycetales bacterium]|nr:hypothetical protein [Planctomycetales bacterium]
MSRLLAEVADDLEELRKQHPNDCQLRNVVMRWGLEKERLLVRHGDVAVVTQWKKVRKHWPTFVVGLLVMDMIQQLLRLTLG